VTPSRRDLLVERGLIESAGLGHEMIQRMADRQTALYVCRRCLLTLTVGYPAGSADRNMRLMSAPALTTACSGKGYIATWRSLCH